MYFNAFFFIALDLTARDALHEQWKHERLTLKMFTLIAAGSILSALLNRDASRIALASFMAFAAAGASDTVVYAMLGEKSRLLKMNGSNVVSAGVDSIVFPALAFGFPLAFTIMAGQFACKIIGGFLWSLVLNRQVVALSAPARE